MQGFQMKDLLESLGPTASLIFAAWIFLSFLQQRYVAAYEKYKTLMAEYREDPRRDKQEKHGRHLREQLMLYRTRCEHMRRATTIGVTSAILLILALISAALGTMASGIGVFKYLTAVCAISGLALVIWAAALVIAENQLVRRLMDSEFADLPEPEAGVLSRSPTPAHAQRELERAEH